MGITIGVGGKMDVRGKKAEKAVVRLGLGKGQAIVQSRYSRSIWVLYDLGDGEDLVPVLEQREEG